MSTELRRIIKEMPNYETTILDDPLVLLKTIEQQVHVPSRAVYPTLTLIESLSRLLNVRQGDKECLTSYMERFKSEKMYSLICLGMVFSMVIVGIIQTTKVLQDQIKKSWIDRVSSERVKWTSCGPYYTREEQIRVTMVACLRNGDKHRRTIAIYILKTCTRWWISCVSCL